MRAAVMSLIGVKDVKKTIIIGILLCLLSCAVSFGATYSYLITQTGVSNIMTVGEVRTSIQEEFDPPAQLSPGISFRKEPFAVNEGNLPCFIRMRADYSTVKAGDFCTLTGLDTTCWVKEEDGYYYYKYLHAPGEKTQTAPFSGVHISNDCNEIDLDNFDIAIYAEAIQHKDHDGPHPENEYLTEWQQYHKE